MKWRGLAYRAHDPRWAFAPLSGDGAAIHGGRFNPKGKPALYLARTIEGMIVETAHGFAYRFKPLTICTYLVDMDGLVDLTTDEGRAAEGVSLDDLGCAWEYEASEGRTPASWRVAEDLEKRGTAGLIAPSFANGARPAMTNLVLWRWGPDPPHRVEIHDPDGRLPKNQSSWD